MNKKKHPISLKRAMAALGLILVLSLACCGVMRTRQPPLPSWRAFRREMLDKYSYIDKLTAKQAHRHQYNFTVWCYYGDISQEEKEALQTELKTFLSSEEFLAEYIPFAHEIVDDVGILGLTPYMPKIVVRFSVSGSGSTEWMSETSYYKENFRSDRILTVDNYQTWHTIITSDAVGANQS